MKIVYLMHAIGGDVQKNVQDLLDIIREINLHEPNVVPFAPYLPDVLALDDSNPQHRARGIQNDTEIIRRGFINEAWVVGDKITEGMQKEIELFNKMNVPVVRKKKFEPNVSSIQKIDTCLLPEKFKVDLLIAES